MSGQSPTESELAAMREGARIKELMSQPGYYRDMKAQSEVREAFQRYYGTAPIAAPVGPGQAAAGGFDRDGI
jgi:hypothetical protein